MKSKFIVNEILPCNDMLVDVNFDESQKDNSLAWCGSSNQRVIKVQERLKTEQVETPKRDNKNNEIDATQKIKKVIKDK